MNKRLYSGMGICIVALLTAMVLFPLLFLVMGAFSTSGLPSPFAFTLEHVQSVFFNASIYKLFLTSFWFGVGSLIVSCLFAIPMAWFIERTNIAYKSFMRLMILASVGIPGLLTALAWTLLASPGIGFLNQFLPFTLNIYSFFGMIFVQGISVTPLTYLMVSPAMRNLDSSLEEAGKISSGYPTVIRRITVGLLRPSLLAAFIYIFIICLLSFDVPATLGVPAKVYVLSSEVYFATAEYSVPRYGYAAALSLFTLIAGFIITTFYMRASVFESKYATVTGKLKITQHNIGKVKILGYVWFWFFILVSTILPIFILVWTSLLPYLSAISFSQIQQMSLENFTRVLNYPRVLDSIQNTLVISFITATLTTFFAALVSWFVVKSKVKWSKLADLLVFLPLVIPGIALGLSLRFTFLSLTFIPIYGTIWIMVLAFWIDSLPFATRNINSGIVQVHSDMEEASQISGASFLTTFRKVLLPLILPTLAFVWLWTFLRGLREFTTAVMLYTPRSQVMSTILFQNFNSGEVTVAAGVSVIMLIFILPLTFGVLIWLDRSRAKSGLL